MKNKIIAGLAAIATAVVLVVGGSALAQAAPDGPASYVQLTRVPSTTLTASNGSYTDLTSTSKWSIQNEQGGYTFGANGITVPVTGIYRLDWSVLATGNSNGIFGFAINGATPDGGILHAIGPVVQLAASTGNGSVVIPLQANDDIKFWGYGSGNSISLQTSIANRLTVTLIDEL